MNRSQHTTFSTAVFRASQATPLNRFRAFTLVELLVVITIIGILASLITVAAVGALKRARETAIKTEINQMDTALAEYKNKTTAFPPNCQTDGTGSDNPLNEVQIFNDLQRHMKLAFPRHQEKNNLIRVLAGLAPVNEPGDSASNYSGPLPGGISAGEALVFWLGGFSSDPKYPISGEGGPAYRIRSLGSSDNRQLDPIESRDWTFPFDVGRLGPRADDNYFDDSSGRFIEYTVAINGQPQLRRLNFWQYAPRKSQQPYLYFDTSRHPPTAEFDPPAATALSRLGPDGAGLHVHAMKKQNASADPRLPVPIQFINPEKFQILHSGDDGAWGEEAFERMSVHGVQEAQGDPAKLADYVLFPSGPFTGELADTIVNFTTETKLEDGQQ